MSDILLDNIWIQAVADNKTCPVAKDLMWPFGQFSIKTSLVLIRMPRRLAACNF